MLFRASLAARVTFREHLSEVHWTVSNGLLIASERHLSTEHPIRRLIKPHTYGAAEINEASTSALAPIKGLAWRAFGFSKSDWSRMLSDQVKSFKYQTLEEHFIAAGLPNELKHSLPLYEDGLELYQIFEKYVRAYVNIFYKSEEAVLSDVELVAYWNDYATQLPDRVSALPELTKENLVKQLTYSFFHVTAFHQFVGAATEYFVDPFGMCGMLAKNANCGTIQGCVYMMVLLSLTQLKRPLLINDWTHLHDYLKTSYDLETYEKVVSVIDDWQKDLKDFSKVVAARNKEREDRDEQSFVAMDSKILDCSVSV